VKIKDFKLGATEKFPRGPVDETDEGELRLALVADHQQAIVRLIFGKQISWLGLPAREARDLARILVEKADELDRRKT